MQSSENVSKEVAKAVVIAGLSALVVKLVEWGVEEVKELVGRDTPASSSEADESK